MDFAWHAPGAEAAASAEATMPVLTVVPFLRIGMEVSELKDLNYVVLESRHPYKILQGVSQWYHNVLIFSIEACTARKAGEAPKDAVGRMMQKWLENS